MNNWAFFRWKHILLKLVTSQIRWTNCFCFQKLFSFAASPLLMMFESNDPESRDCRSQVVLTQSVSWASDVHVRNIYCPEQQFMFAQDFKGPLENLFFGGRALFYVVLVSLWAFRAQTIDVCTMHSFELSIASMNNYGHALKLFQCSAEVDNSIKSFPQINSCLLDRRTAQFSFPRGL